MYIDLKQLIEQLEVKPMVGVNPILAILKYGERHDSEAYIRSIQRKANELGVKVVTVDLENVDNVVRKIDEVQALADAVLPVRPFPNFIETTIKLTIDSFKDIDNFAGKNIFKNCTVEAVERILNFLDISQNKRVCILGRHLGLEIGLELLENDFSPTVCHSKVTPIKNGVGAVTTTILFKHIFDAI